MAHVALRATLSLHDYHRIFNWYCTQFMTVSLLSWNLCMHLVDENDWIGCDQVGIPSVTMWYANIIAGLIGLIFVVGLPPWCSDAFNVETKHYAVYRNETRSMFGFAVSVYRDRYGRGWWVFGCFLLLIFFFFFDLILALELLYIMSISKYFKCNWSCATKFIHFYLILVKY